jgi:hypothetical protein
MAVTLLLAGAVLLLAAGYASADHHYECDTLNIIKIKSQWARAYSHGHSREHFAEAVWRTALNLSPALKDRFHTLGIDDVHSSKFRAYAVRTLAAVEMAITFLDNPEALKAEMEFFHKKVEERHIPDEFIDTFITALKHVIPAQLGRCWDRQAWKACLGSIAEGIKGH